jgi:nucleoside transporter
MMFLQHSVLGAVVPILSHYLKNDLHFAPFYIGVIMGLPALTALFAPAFAGQVADRYLSAERMLGVCHLIAGVFMMALSFQTSFSAFFWMYLCYSLLFVPTLALSNTVGFHHVPDAKTDFAKVRLWGTVGWVVVAWTFGLLWLGGDAGTADSRLADGLRLSALLSWALALYSLFLPKSPSHGGGAPFAPWKAVQLFLRPSLLVLCAATFFNCITHQFLYYGMGPYLSHLGVSNRFIMPVMSIAQASEVVVMALMGFFTARISLKNLLIIGVLMQTFRYALFAFVPVPAVVVLGIATHGFCFSFFFLVAYIYVDMQSGPSERARAQQLYNIIYAGFGNLAGFLFAGKVAEVFTLPGTTVIDYRYYWTFPGLLALATGIGLALFFREEASAREREEAARREQEPAIATALAEEPTGVK